MTLKVNISINSGAALILYLLSFFTLTTEAAFFPAVERLYPVAIGALTGAFAGFLVKRANNNKLGLTADPGTKATNG